MGIMDMFGKAIGDTMSALGKEARTEQADVRIDEVITTLVVDSQSGNVQVAVHGDAAATHVEVGRTLYMYGEARPQVTEAIDGETLTLRAHASDSMRMDRVDHFIEVPAGTTVHVRTTAGNVTVGDLSAPVDITSEAGNLKVERIDGPVSARTNAGNVMLTEVSGIANATTQAGAITATSIGGELTASSSAGSITARDLRGGRVVARSQAGKVIVAMVGRPDYVEADASVGAVQVEVPAGAYHVVTKVAIGSAKVENVTHDPASPNRISASSQAGSVKVVGIVAAAAPTGAPVA